jgi:excisionase family DNA binding protein
MRACILASLNERSDAMEDALKPMLVKPTTAAKLLGCGVTKVYELIKRGELKTVPFETDQRIPYSEIERLAASGVRKPRS